MPLYEFECKKCRVRFEALVSLGKEKEVACSQCGSRDIQKCLSTFGIGGGSNRTSSSSSNCGTCSTGACSTCR